MLYACDGRWWHHRGGVPEFAGLKVTQDLVAARAWRIRHVKLTRPCTRLLMDEAGVIGAGSGEGAGNSGFHALNLAVQFGAARVVLVGFDMNLAGGVHWHGRHGGGLNNPSAKALARWAAALDAQAGTLADLGVEVFNTCPTSALEAFPTATLEEALTCSR